MPTPLILIGAGGFARETIELVRAVNREAPTWELVGLLDDDPELRGQQVLGVPVLGPCESVAEYPEAAVVACVASPRDPLRRLRLVARLGLPLARHATLIHPRATVAESATIGPGSVVHANCVLTADIRLGWHVAMMPAVVLTHDDAIEDGVTFAAGVRVASGVTIEAGAYIGAGALLREHVSVGAGALVGMGSVLTRSVPGGETWYGAPARPAPRTQRLEAVR
jgi:sugar O-acyltransferase (sialic acid O-acetyltransferase NeuD family)